MQYKVLALQVVVFSFLATLPAAAQAPVQEPTRPAAASGAVPSLVNYSGVLKDANGRTRTSITGVTFLLYQDEQGGPPLWMETQNVTPDKTGHYTVQLGATSASGLPADLFVSGEARWLAVQIVGQAEEPRVLLVAVPYAMKAVDAQTLGGLPASAFVLAAPPAENASPVTSGGPTAASASVPPAASSDVTTTGGTANKIPMFTTATNVQNSILTQTGTTAINVGGKLNLPATGTATTTTGKNSQPEAFVASSFSSSTRTAVNQTFQWQAEPAANDTANPSGTLNLLYGLGATAASETGLKLSSKGLFTFAAGQTFPGTGTITGVTTASGSGLAGGGRSGTLKLSIPAAGVTNAMLQHPSLTVNPGTALTGGGAITLGGAATLNLDTTKVPLLASANTFTANQTIDGGLTATNGNGIGIYGVASSLNGIGVFGESVSESTTGLTTAGMGAGVWGDGGSGSSGRIGVVGTVDDNIAGLFINNSPSEQYTMYVQSLNSAANPFIAYGTGGSCDIDANGNLTCTGTVSTVVPINGGKRMAAMSAIVSPVNWTEDAGESQLSNGAAVVEMDSTFTSAVNTEMKYQVFLTPYGDCKGLYVTNRTANSFEVHELGGGTSNLSFGYRIMAVRKSYEAIRFADHRHDLNVIKNMREPWRQTRGIRPRTGQ